MKKIFVLWLGALFLVGCGGGGGASNVPPVANAGAAQTVEVGDVAQLDGSASSDPDGNPLTYAWNIVTRPAGSVTNLAMSDTAKPSFFADVAGEYVASLVVHDGISSSPNDEVKVVARFSNPVLLQKFETIVGIAPVVVELNWLSQEWPFEGSGMRASSYTQF